MSFNPALYLYLNPKLSAFSNVTNVSQATTFYQSYSNLNGTLLTYDSINGNLPNRSDEYVFIADNKSNVDISHLNQVIKSAMCNQGISPVDIEQNGSYMTTIYKDAVLINSNVFSFSNLQPTTDQFFITTSNLNIGDEIKIVKNNIFTYYANIQNIIDNQTFQVSSSIHNFTDSNANYMIYGIKIYDPYRLAVINYFNTYNTPSNPIDPNFYKDDTQFNPDLYRLLYPDARQLDDASAFVDYVNREGNLDYRIGRTHDIIPMNSNIPTTFDNLVVSKTFSLNFCPNTGYFKFKDVYLYYCSTDSVTSSSNLPTNSNFPYEALITERAIKTYVDNAFTGTATFCNINVTNSATICNLTVGGSNPAIFNTDVEFNENICVTGSMMGPRIGIGPCSYTFSNCTCSNNIMQVSELIATSNLIVGQQGITTGTICTTVHGLIQADNLSALSDRRLKTDIHDISPIRINEILTNIKDIKVRKFDWKHLHLQCNSKKKNIGFIAQELEQIIPEAVSTIKSHIVACSLSGNVLPHNTSYYFVHFDKSHDFENVHAIWFANNENALINDIDFDIVDANTIMVNRAWNGDDTCTIDKIEYSDVKIVDYQMMSCILFALFITTHV